MSKGDKKPTSLDIRALPEQSMMVLSKAYRYRLVVFAVFVLVVYGYVSFKIISYSNPSTNTGAVDTQVTSLTPRIDESLVNQLQSLKDNSVNVRTLFDEARKNPFAE